MKNNIKRLGLGCGGMSYRKNPQQSVKTIHKALDEGICLFNTGDLYGTGESEMIVGEALKNVPRDKYFISVKYGMLLDPKGVMYGLDCNPFNIKAHLAYSMKRLGLDYIDLFQPARIDETVPIEETIGVLSELVEQGYIGNIGLSMVDEETLRRADKVHHIHTVEMEYSVIDRDIENDIIPTAKELGINVVTFGLLSHRLISEEVISGKGETMLKFGRFSPENLENNINVIKELKEIADKKNMTISQLAFAWALNKNSDIQCLIGTTNTENLQKIIDILDTKLTQEDITKIENTISADKILGRGMDGVRFRNGVMMFNN